MTYGSVAARAYLECLQLLGDAGREVHVVGRQAGHQAPVAGIHGREQLGLGVHADDGVEGTERLDSKASGATDTHRA